MERRGSWTTHRGEAGVGAAQPDAAEGATGGAPPVAPARSPGGAGLPARRPGSWEGRPPLTRRQLRDTELIAIIAAQREDKRTGKFVQTLGSRKMWIRLRGQGHEVARCTVERIMREHGLQGAHLRRGWRTGSTRQNPSHTAAPDLVDRDFRATAPNRLWVADLTRLVTGEGVLWLASVRDAFANRIVGWATDPRATTTLVLTALNHALGPFPIL